MLTQAELTGALHAALKACTPACKPWCVVGAEVTEDGRYRIWHNGTGARDTNAQTVYADTTLGFAQAGLSHKLRTWLEGCHLGLPIDLNAAMATRAAIRTEYLKHLADRSPAMPGAWPFRVQITDCVRREDAPKIDFGRVARALIKPEYLGTQMARDWATGGTLP